MARPTDHDRRRFAGYRPDSLSQGPGRRRDSLDQRLDTLQLNWQERLAEEAEALAGARYATSIAGEALHDAQLHGDGSTTVGLLIQFRNALLGPRNGMPLGARARVQRSLNNVRLTARDTLEEIDHALLEEDPDYAAEVKKRKEEIGSLEEGRDDLKKHRERSKGLSEALNGALEAAKGDKKEPGLMDMLGARMQRMWNDIKEKVKTFTSEMDGLRMGGPSDATGAERLRLWRDVLRIQEVQQGMPDNPSPQQILNAMTELKQPLERIDADLGDMVNGRTRTIEEHARLLEGFQADHRDAVMASRPRLAGFVENLENTRDGFPQLPVQELDKRLAMAPQGPALTADQGPDADPALALTPALKPGSARRRAEPDEALVLYPPAPAPGRFY